MRTQIKLLLQKPL